MPASGERLSESAGTAGITYDQWLRREGVDRVEAMCRFFMRDDAVHQSLRKVTQKLEQLGIPYAVAGGMALAANGYIRATTDVDILLTVDGLRRAHEALDGLGYVPAFTGSKHLKDAETSVRVKFLVAGQFPGDGKPKPVAFPDPSAVAFDVEGIRYLRLSSLVELKLASGISNAGRLKDLADVQELIRGLRLPREIADGLNPYVQPKFFELWDAIAADPQAEG